MRVARGHGSSLRLVPIPSGWRPSLDRRQDLSDPGDVLFWIGDFQGSAEPRYNRRVHFVYIVRCADGTLYTGYARAPRARERAHKSGRGAKYTAGLRPVRLVYQEAFPVCGEGAGTRVRREATYSRAEGRVGRQRETTPPLNPERVGTRNPRELRSVNRHLVRAGGGVGNLHSSEYPVV